MSMLLSWFIATISIIALTYLPNVNAQNVTTSNPIMTTTVPVATQTQLQDSTQNTLLSTLIPLGLGIGGLAVKQNVNHNKNKAEVKGTDLDFYQYMKMNNMVWARLSRYPDKKVGEVLDMPLNEHPDALDKSSIRLAMGKYETDWDDYVKANYTVKE